MAKVCGHPTYSSTYTAVGEEARFAVQVPAYSTHVGQECSSKQKGAFKTASCDRYYQLLMMVQLLPELN